MIQFKYPEERDYLSYFAGVLGDGLTMSFLGGHAALTEDRARHLSTFFWQMVDCSIALEKTDHFPWPEGAEFWNEKLLRSISGYLQRSGFEDVWDQVVDQQ